MNSREQFEAHYDDWTERPGYTKECRVGDTYSWPRMSQAWFHWQASRAAVVVELPDSSETVGQYSSEVYRLARDEFVDAIAAAGLKVAP